MDSTEQKNSAVARQRKINRQSTWIILIGILVFGAITVYVAKKSVSSFSKYVEPAIISTVPEVELFAYQKKTDGALSRLNTIPAVNETIFFKLSTVRPIHAAMGLAVNEQSPQIVFQDAKIPPGPNRLFEKEDNVYRYVIQPTDKKLRFCLFQADSAEHLLTRIQQLQQAWSMLPSTACVELF